MDVSQGVRPWPAPRFLRGKKKALIVQGDCPSILQPNGGITRARRRLPRQVLRAGKRPTNSYLSHSHKRFFS